MNEKIENKTENNTPNVKNIKKYLPKLLKDVIGFDKINDVVKDSNGKTVQVNASSSTFNYPNSFYTGYNDKGEAVAVLKQGTDCEKKPFTYVLCDDPDNKYHFGIGKVGYDLIIRPNIPEAVLSDFKEDPAVEIHNNDRKQTPEVMVRDFKGRLIFKQNDKGDYTTYTYLRNTKVVTDYSKTEFNTKLNKESNGIKEYHATQTVVHYEFKATDPYYCTNIIPKYACETENGVLIKEYFVEEDAVGGFVHVIDYKNNEEWWTERDYHYKYPEQGCAHPSHLYIEFGQKFKSRDEYDLYRGKKIDDMKVKEKAREMMMAHPMRMCGPMCGRGPFFG